MQSNPQPFAIATVPLPVQVGTCCECEQATTGRCISCLLPLCHTCERGCGTTCPWCHYMRGDCHDPDCAAFGAAPMPALATERDPLPVEEIA